MKVVIYHIHRNDRRTSYYYIQAGKSEMRSMIKPVKSRALNAEPR